MMMRSAEREEFLLQDLEEAETELRGINTTLAQLHLHLHLHQLSPESADAFGPVRGWYQDSLEAEWQCQASTRDPDSPVGRSHDARRHAESLLMGWRDSLQGESSTQRRLQGLKTKVCGGHGRGDGGCRSLWQRLCGGKGCAQVPRASALQTVSNTTDHITATSKHLQDAAKELQDVGRLARALKIHAAGALLTTKTKSKFFSDSNKELRDSLQNIRSFLSDEGADPDAVSWVSERVLAVSLPANGSVVTAILKEIQHSIANLTHAHRDFDTEQSNRTQELLQQARTTQARASQTEVSANQTRQRLDAARKAIRTTEGALETDREILNSTRSTILTGKDAVLRLESKQTYAALRLAGVQREAESLRRKLDDSGVTVRNISAHANNTAHAAGDLSEELEEAQERQRELQERVRTAGERGAQSLDDVNERVRYIQQQAQDVLKKATESMETLHRLEREFQENKRKMQDQNAELASLERNITATRDYILESVIKYSSC